VTARVDMHEIRELAMDAIADVGTPEDAPRLRRIHDAMEARRLTKVDEAEALEDKLDDARDRSEWGEVRRLQTRQESLLNEAEMIERHLEHVQSALFRLGDAEPIDHRIAELEEAVAEVRRDDELRFALAMAYTRRESYEEAEEIYRDLSDGRSYYRGISTYNLACVLSLQGKTKEALDALYAALDRLWSEAIDHAFEDGDLENLRDAYPNLRELLEARQKEVEERGVERFFR
jgi:tetratricopeptide (TPR) repeat protein